MRRGCEFHNQQPRRKIRNTIFTNHFFGLSVFDYSQADKADEVSFPTPY